MKIEVNGEEANRGSAAKGMIWGFFLIALGGLFVLERLGMFEAPHIGQIWPAVFIVFGMGNLFEGKPGGALWNFLLGVWFFACTFDWYGLTYGNSWPLVLVAMGASMVVKSLTGEDQRRRKGMS